MKNNFKKPRSFTLERVITKYKAHNVDEPAIVNDTNGTELPSSVLSRFEYYDKYEQYNLDLSRFAIEALISPSPGRPVHSSNKFLMS